MSVWEIRCSIGGKPIYDPPSGNAQSNWFEMGQGAFPGQGRVLVAHRDWEALSTTEAVSLEIFCRRTTQEWPSEPSLSIPVVVRGALPWVQPTSDAESDGYFLELAIYDARHDASQATYVNASFNMQKAGFPYVGGGPDFYESTTNSGSEWEWDEIAEQLELTFTDFDFPTFHPRNISFSGCSKAEARSRIASILHAAIAFDPSDASLLLVRRGYTTTENEELWTSFLATPPITSIAEFSDLAFPETLRFVFRVVDASGDPFEDGSRWHEVDKPTGFGRPGTVRAVEVGYWMAKEAGGSIFNETELGQVATYLFDANILERYETVGDFKNAGIWAFTPDGYLRRILWVFDANEISTTVRVNSDLPIRARTGAHEITRASHVADAIGSATAVQTIDGRTHFDASPATADEFDAIITGNQVRATNKWKYAWVSAVLDGDDYIRQSPPERSGTTGGDYAINGDETGNTATFGAGVKLNAPGFPAGMKVVAIGADYTGALFDVHVRMRRTTDAGGATRYAFNRPNVVDGTCT